MTVLQALDRYYDRMAERGEAEPPGYSRERVGFAVVLSAEGAIVDVLDLRAVSGKRVQPASLEVPAAVKRTVAISPNLFWDKTSYALGRTAGEGRRTAEEHAAFRQLHLDLLPDAADAGLVAFRRFLESWSIGRFDAAPFRPEMLDANFVFRLDSDEGFIHQREAAKGMIAARVGGDGTKAFCLVTGVESPVRRLHPTIKGVDGAQSSGAALVSFNLDAFESYGKEQGANAPTSEAAAFRYGAALNRLLDRAGRNRIKVGDATVAFWADASGVGEDAAKAAEDIFAFLVDPPDDAGEAAKIAAALKLLAKGRPVKELDPKLEPGTRFHVLGLAPNAARLSIRFWETQSFEVFAGRLAAHHRDLELKPTPRGWTKPPSIQRLLVRTTALQEKFDNIPPLLAGEVARAVLTGAPYPRTLLAAAVIRLRADLGSGWHAAVVKACLNRPIERELDGLRREGVDPERQTRLQKERSPVSLEPERRDPPYQLGRLFAVLESAQYAALGRVNAPIGDRYYGAASATPARVFGTLLRGLKNHVSDARKRGQGGWIEPKVAEIMSKLPPELPRTLKLEEQGRFAIGYYHERGTRAAKDSGEADKTDEKGGDQE